MKKLLFVCLISVSLHSYSADTGKQEKMPMNLTMRKQPSEQNARLSHYEWKPVFDRVCGVYWQGSLRAEYQDRALLPVKLSRRMSLER